MQASNSDLGMKPPQRPHKAKYKNGKPLKKQNQKSLLQTKHTFVAKGSSNAAAVVKQAATAATKNWRRRFCGLTVNETHKRNG